MRNMKNTFVAYDKASNEIIIVIITVLAFNFELIALLSNEAEYLLSQNSKYKINET